jgi:uncharacterized protein CbrC (UPF0167 family)
MPALPEEGLPMTVQTVPYRCPSCQRTAAVEFEGIPPTQAELEDLDPCPWCSAGWGDPDDGEGDR